ncbi:hypothetical protein OH768_44100 [Streptomyces sp. NBC_01622]|uniref:hypothetical protein n=1 Tax=Streptomyces sp. NBC_01622 TaxID=2975903 RepID=UPI003865320D|nr:hypothetical protein OH768_24850 [Streptomyces sp. NBC_01622]WTE46863.1 hypothetical protein OH768_44100 [Streptomyces sp. NBC_01622]
MRWLVVGALLGLLAVFPSLLAVVAAIAAAILGKPVLVAFGVGLAVRPTVTRRVRGWAP